MQREGKDQDPCKDSNVRDQATARGMKYIRARTSGPGMCLMGMSVLPAKPSTRFCISFIDTISSEPRFTGSAKSDFVRRRMPDLQGPVS